MKWHITSWLFTKFYDFLPFVIYMFKWSLHNKRLCFLLIHISWKNKNYIFFNDWNMWIFYLSCGFNQERLLYCTYSLYRLTDRLLREVVLNNMILFKYSGLLKLSFPFYKVKQILEDSLDSIPSPSVKIQIMGGKVGLRCKGKTLGIVNFFVQKVCWQRPAMFGQNNKENKMFTTPWRWWDQIQVTFKNLLHFKYINTLTWKKVVKAEDNIYGYAMKLVDESILMFRQYLGWFI